MAKAFAIVIAQRLVALEQFVAAQQQLREIDRALALAGVLVGAIDLDQASGVIVGDVDGRRPKTLLLGTSDEVLDVLRRKLLVVDLHSLQHALDDCELVLGVQDLKARGQRGITMMDPQHPVTEPVERADPHPARIDREHHRQPRHHLAGRLVGEGHAEKHRRTRLAGADQPGDARRQHARLAAARPCENQCMARRQRDGGTLFRIQVSEQVH